MPLISKPATGTFRVRSELSDGSFRDSDVLTIEFLSEFPCGAESITSTA